MRVVAGMSDRLPLGETGDYARRVERLGFDALHVPETIHDSMAVALLALEHTTTLRVRTSLTLAFPRSPMLLALQAWDLARLSGGRFDLGLATQIRQNVEGRFGVEWLPPVARMRDYVSAVRGIWRSFSTGEPLRVVTDNYRLDRLQPFFDPGPLDCRAPEIWLGGVNDEAIRLAVDVADGLVTHPTNSHPRFVTECIAPVMSSAARRPLLVTTSPIVTGRSIDDLRSSREAQRTVLAFLYSTPAYRRTLELFGWDDLGSRLRDAIRRNAWGELPDLLDDERLDTLLPSGTWDDLPDLIQRWFGGVADAVLVQPPATAEDDDHFAAVVQAISAT